MNASHRLFCLGLLLTVLLIGASFIGHSDAAGQHPDPVIAATSPPDVAIPDGFSDNPIAFFDDFSWRTFLALSWPAQTGARGQPDTQRILGDATGPRVWETWKADYEIFQPNGAPPSEWQSTSAISPCPEVAFATAGAEKVLRSFSKGGNVLEAFNQASFGVPSGALVAQNGTYVRYEMRTNRAEFDFIRGAPEDPTSALYLRSNLPTGGSPELRFPDGSISVKAAWRELSASESSLFDRYYHVTARLFDPVTRQCTTKTMGLVGFHIVERTPSRPQWVWATFEHVDNVVVGPNAPAGTKPSFNNPVGPQTGPSVDRLERPINATHPPSPKPQPSQVVRLKTINPSTEETNTLYQKKLAGTVWTNYKLVMTQWPTQPANPGAGNPFPSDAPTSTSTSNVTLETQAAFQRGVSCMTCHVSDKPANTEFVWFLSIHAFPQAPSDAARSLRTAFAATKVKK